MLVNLPIFPLIELMAVQNTITVLPQFMDVSVIIDLAVKRPQTTIALARDIEIWYMPFGSRTRDTLLRKGSEA